MFVFERHVRVSEGSAAEGTHVGGIRRERWPCGFGFGFGDMSQFGFRDRIQHRHERHYECLHEHFYEHLHEHLYEHLRAQLAQRAPSPATLRERT